MNRPGVALAGDCHLSVLTSLFLSFGCRSSDLVFFRLTALSEGLKKHQLCLVVWKREKERERWVDSRVAARLASVVGVTCISTMSSKELETTKSAEVFLPGGPAPQPVTFFLIVGTTNHLIRW